MKKALLVFLAICVTGIITFGTTIDFMMMSGSGARDFINEAVPLFEKETGIKVNVEFTSWGEGWTKLMAMVASGEGPDVTQVGTTWVGALQATGAFTDLTSLEKYFGGEENFLGGPWKTRGYDNRMYAVPWFADIRALVYRKDLMEKYDLPNPPKTWGDLLYSAIFLKEKGEMEYPVGLRGKGNGHYVGSFLWQNNTDIISEDGNEVLLDSEKAFESVKFWADMLGKYKVMSPGLADMGHNEICVSFFNGEVAFMYPGPWFVLKVDRKVSEDWLKSGKIGIALQPGKNENLRTGFVGGSDLMVSVESKKKEAALKWIKFLARPEIQALLAEKMFVAPTVKAAYQEPFFHQEPYAQMWEDFKVVGDAGSHYPIHPAWGAMERFVPQIIVDIFSSNANGNLNDEKIHTLLKQYNRELQDALDSYK
ncbi:MAG: hypothetical protein DRP32_04730 [Thermotogae bacterium]|nr:MAG: hypothetical protein DRP32_04730 [Thermotogota bacterium]